tara:strand:- start:1652 stop:2038 length:387 start_codon:yes stop_codon:yes gene_type:complete
VPNFIRRSSSDNQHTPSEDMEYVSFDMLRTSDHAWGPEQLLWLAVISQAILDATKEPRDNDSESIQENRRASIRWLTTTSACVTAEDMEDVCESAGISAQNIRRLCTSIIYEGRPFERFRINALLDST